MYVTAIVPGLIVMVGRLSVIENGPWLFSRGMMELA
jgi:hypothetical protein